MFEIALNDINRVLNDFGIDESAIYFEELQRYHYERHDPESKEVRLIVKACFAQGKPVVIRFKNENDVSLELLESQSMFAELIRNNGVLSPVQYKSDGAYARWYALNGYYVMATVEEFVDGEIKCVDPDIARRTGRLLAITHDIAEKFDFHVKNAVLFDPFDENDLFKFTEFRELGQSLHGEAADVFRDIMGRYGECMHRLAPLRDEPRYAVQGDISDCNLFMGPGGEVGIFDFNRCGDNNLFCDAAMQAVFEARLMDYPEDCAENLRQAILAAFLNGYQSVRPFTQSQRELFPYLYAVVDAFWAADIMWNEDSLLNQNKRQNDAGVIRWLREIYRRISDIRPMEAFEG